MGGGESNRRRKGGRMRGGSNRRRKGGRMGGGE